MFVEMGIFCMGTEESGSEVIIPGGENKKVFCFSSNVFFPLSRRTSNFMKTLFHYFVDEGVVKNASSNRLAK